jgi:hypothetical protein
MKNSPKHSEGAWIFVSHSTKDILKVRAVRNALEDMGHFPILFFLKSVSERSELDSLIRREIEARDWFLLCDSENARASRWVQQEREMIQSLPGKVYRQVDLGLPLERQIDILLSLSRAASVFISYRHAIKEVAHRIYDAIREAGFRTWMDITDLEPGEDFVAAIKRQIDTALSNGWVLLLIDATYFGDRFGGVDYCRFEATYAIQQNGRLGRSRVIPIVIDDPSIALANAPLELLTIQYFDLYTDFNVGMANLIRFMRS